MFCDQMQQLLMLHCWKASTTTTTTTTPYQRRNICIITRVHSPQPSSIKDCIAQALTQHLFLVQKNDSANSTTMLEGSFVILSLTGNVYMVKVSHHIPSCTCPDHTHGHLCKHILFVLLKVMRLPFDLSGCMDHF